MQAWSLLALDPIAETQGDPNAYGFRSERSTAEASGRCFTVLARKPAASWIVEGDIRACFDGISHEGLVAHLPMDRAMLQQWLQAGFVDKQVLSPTEAGVPQGGIASPVIATLALDGLERLVRDHSPSTTRRGKQAKVHRARYADDCIIPGSSYALLEHEVKPLVEQFLGQRGLELSPEKTRITHMENGFDFLGQHVRKYAGKLLIKPARKHVKACLGKVRHIVQVNKQATTATLRAQLNPLIRGWANYPRHVVSKRTFHHVDTALFKVLWSWAKRRHPKTPRRWGANTYCRHRHGRAWTFVGTRVGKQGQRHELTRSRAGDVPIKRHGKVTGAANP